jgi:C4-dicarboxylate transporter DctM subunit
MTTVVLLVVFLALMFLGIPVVAALAASALVGLLLIGDIPFVSVAQTAVFGIDKFVLLAIPLFVLTGEVMNAGGLSHRLFNLASALVGHLRGGLAQVSVVANLFLGGVSGSSSADAALTTKVLVPAMIQRGYDPGFSGAITAAAAMLGPIIPPSIAMILYGSIVNASIGRLFIAGIIPGVMIALGLGLTVAVISIKRGYRSEHSRQSPIDILRRLHEAGWVLLLPVIVLIGIPFGIMTPTEAGAIAALYAAILGTFVYRAIRLRDYSRILLNAAVDTGVVILIVAVAAAFSFLVTILGVPQQLAQQIIALGGGAVLFIALTNIVLLVAGCLMEATGLLVMVAPILAPIAASLGIDLVHFGMILVLNILIGTVTPPFGQSVFIVSAIGKIPADAIFRDIIRLLPVILGVLVVVSYFPGSFMWLVRLLWP